MTEINSKNSGNVKPVSVALISTDEQWRINAANMLSARPNVRCSEISHFINDPREFAPTLATKFDAVLLDVDNNPDYFFKIAEALSAEPRIYIMAATKKSDMKQAVRFMRIGVREFFTLPVDAAEITAALNRAADRPNAPPSKPVGKLFVFLGAKGGVGVTTLAANFALSLAQQSDKKTLVIDLGLPLGDVAINLGTATDFSVINALADPLRLDANFLETIVTKHDSGLHILGAPTEFPEMQPTVEAFDKLLTVTRFQYEYVVVDAGSRVDLFSTALFEQSTTIYLVTQVGITELRNAHRLITRYFASRGRALQVVLNRYTQRALLFDDGQISKTITRDIDWKLPDDYAAARRVRESATPLAQIESSLTSMIEEMVRSAADITVETGKKGFFRMLGKSSR